MGKKCVINLLVVCCTSLFFVMFFGVLSPQVAEACTCDVSRSCGEGGSCDATVTASCAGGDNELDCDCSSISGEGPCSNETAICLCYVQATADCDGSPAGVSGTKYAPRFFYEISEKDSDINEVECVEP